MASPAPAIDLLDASSFAHGHPHEQYAWLRANDPVHRHAEPDGPGFWAVTRHADVRAVGRNPKTFSSSPTIMIPDDSGLDLGDHVMMLMADPPQHTAMRRMVVPDFLPKAVAALRPRIGDLASQIIDGVCERGECDLVEDIAGEMPSFVIAELLGIPLEDGRELYHLTEAIHAAPGSRPPEVGPAAVGQMLAYAISVYQQRKAHPRRDLSSRLAHHRQDGRDLDEIDFALWFLLLVDAGGDTTRNLVAGGIDALFDHPDEHRRLLGHLDALLPSAIDELLRWVSPVAYMRRTATADAVIGKQPIAAGDKVVMWYGSANRDETVFADPARLDLSRTPNDHVAFGGGGPHFCLGAHLARAEVSALLREIITRLPDLGRAGPTVWLESVFISGPSHLPVQFSPVRPAG